MPSTINTNVNSLTAQRNMNRTQNDLGTSIARLSSGLRINSAKDDAAGLAISERFTSQIRGLNQAARNANDGISLAQTAEGAMQSIGNNLQRMRELAVQSANATNSASDRTALQQEVTQLAEEINRVATQTQFNGKNLLDGTFANQEFQVGANAGQTIKVAAIDSARTADLGVSYKAKLTSPASTLATPLTAGALTLNGVSIQAATGGSAAGQDSDSAWAVAQAINNSQGTVVATADPTTTDGAALSGTSFATVSNLKINGVLVGTIAGGTDEATQGANVVNAINQASAASGVTAAYDAGTKKITLTAADGRNIKVEGGTTATTGFDTTSAVVARGKVSLATDASTAAGASIVIGGSAPANAGFTTAGTTAAALSGTSIAKVDISSVAGANAALSSIDGALKTINSSRATLGAIQNRFSSTIENLQTNSENLAASRSRIQDADFAQETANLSRAQVLQQAGTAMIAQANQLPQQVLSLLR